MERQQDYVLRTVEERGVRLIRLWFTDVLGQLKSVAISPAELENAFDEGMHFDGSAIDGFSRVQESDVLAKPDPNTLRAAPLGRLSDEISARMFCDIQTHDGTPVRGRPPPGAQAQPRQGPRAGLLVHGRARDGVLLLRRGRPQWQPLVPLDTGVVLRPHDRRRRERSAQAHAPHARDHGHPRRVLLPRGRAEPARDRPALHATRSPWPTT